MAKLGISIENDLLDKWEQVDGKIKNSIKNIKTGLLTPLIAVANQVAKLLELFEDFTSYYGAFSVNPGANGQTRWQQVAANAREKNISMINSWLDLGARNKPERHAAGVAAIVDNMTARGSASRTSSAKAAAEAEAIVKKVFASNSVRAADALAAVGGFTSAADKEMKTIQQNQLIELKDISKNTKVSITS
jgi:hypothetical protein